MKNRAIKRNRRRGFTLLEIMLVVGLLALLAAIAIPNLMGAGEEAKKKLALSSILPNGSIMRAITQYKFDTGQYPEGLKDLIEKPSDDDVAKKWTGPYLVDKSGLKDPWDREFKYSREGQHNENGVDLWSVGPDGNDGSDDDIVNWETDK